MSPIKLNRWAWIIASVAIAGGALVLGFLLVLTTENRERFEPHFAWLLWSNVAVAALLSLVIVLALGRLALRLRRRKFGSRLLLKLAGIFALVALLPGLLIYTVSYQFVSRSIETWFDVRVEGALDAGLNLARGTLDTLSADLAKSTRLAAEQHGLPPTSWTSGPSLMDLEQLRERLRAEHASLVNDNGQIVLSAEAPGVSGLPTDRVPQAWRQRAQTDRVMVEIEGLDEGGDALGAPPPETARIIALAAMPDNGMRLSQRKRYLLISQTLPPDIVRNALEVQSAYREYQQRSLGREGLRRMYIGTLTLTLVLAVFGAFLLAAVLGQQLARPLLLLAEGVGEVARGDLRPKAIFASHDELGGLTRAFAAMTQQLADARTLAERSVQELDSARAHLQTVLDNLSAGVLVFGPDGRLLLVNPGATRILRLPMSAYIGRRLEDVPGLQDFARTLNERFDAQANDPTPGERQQWQDSYELSLPQHADTLTLLVRGADLPPDERLIVFDDLTDVVSAQRAQAWGEVARRVAHEIKNPLTPIQLSAERLQMKLEPQLEEPGRQLLTRSVHTIVTQVQALKTLVNEFRDFARLPSAQLKPLDLNRLVQDVTALYGQALDQGTLVLDLRPDLPMIRGDATLLRQLVHNLIQNALDACQEGTSDQAPARVEVCTDAPLNDEGQVRAVRLIVRDNGPGFPDKVLKRAFEPYLTTKAHGTGLGLAVVKKVADEHRAQVKLRNRRAEPAPGPAESGELGYPSEEGTKIGAQVSLSFSPLSSDSDRA
ncbi:PAS domain-containing protein [Aquabacterium fontiphilum]|uniref:sensor histidine kinase n=1 Tax=Aquabacterium fontiphilum TaxID=450365 RepID=UPI0013767D31|nr:ATP-binding protein [Aquabacterium fontiphilum]NBD19582.1 PAS domain-containing protein [Aquabacterium fontiphilum]